MAYRECEDFFRMLDRAHKCTSVMVKKRLDEIREADELPEFAGVKIFFYEKKYRELVRHRM